MSQGDELKDELRDIARRTRALLTWMDDSGASGVPRDDAVRPARAASHVEPSEPPPRRRDTAERERDAERRPAADTSAPAATARQRSAPVEASGRPAAPETTTAHEALPTTSEPDRRERMAALAERVSRCTRCPLHAHRKQTVFERGSPNAELCFVGEGPGAQEDAQGIPFVGPAGELLDKMVHAMGFERDEVYICNIVKCRPPNNRKPTPDEMQACEPYLREQLALVAPEVLVAMGATAVQGLLEWYDAGPHGPGITRLRGSWKVYRGRTPLMPTFHPAYLLRSPDKKRDVWSDLQAVMRRLGREPPPPKRTRGG